MSDVQDRITSMWCPYPNYRRGGAIIAPQHFVLICSILWRAKNCITLFSTIPSYVGIEDCPLERHQSINVKPIFCVVEILVKQGGATIEPS